MNLVRDNSATNAQLIARLSPEVALAVYEALVQAASDLSVYHQNAGGHSHNEPSTLQDVREAIRLLDGQRSP